MNFSCLVLRRSVVKSSYEKVATISVLYLRWILRWNSRCRIQHNIEHCCERNWIRRLHSLFVFRWHRVFTPRINLSKGGGRSQLLLRPWQAWEHEPVYGGLGTTSETRPAMAGVAERAPPPIKLSTTEQFPPFWLTVLRKSYSWRRARDRRFTTRNTEEEV